MTFNYKKQNKAQRKKDKPVGGKMKKKKGGDAQGKREGG